MEKMVLLMIKTGTGTIKIPFLDLESLDLFTVRYTNRDELIKVLNGMLKLSLLPSDVQEVYVYCEYISRKNLHKYKNDYVKYSNDNFDISYLAETFSLYLKQDHSRIKKCGVKDINTKAMYEFRTGEDKLTDFDIDVAVKKYLTNAPYRTFRKVYFMIKDIVKVRKNKVVREEDKIVERKLSSFSSDNEYFQYLIEFASRGEEEREKAIEELSKYDIDELDSMLNHSHYGLFDGTGYNSDFTLEEVYDLEKYTGLSIEELTAYVESGRRSGRKR